MLKFLGVVKLINFFVSHWWGGEFLSFVETLRLHALACAQTLKVRMADVSYWICTFNNSQHRVELGDTLHDSPFYGALCQIDACKGAVVLMAEPFEKPEMLKRAWCIYEIMTSGRMEMVT